MTQEDKLQEVLNKLVVDPKYIQRVLRSNEVSVFKERYQVDHASPLRCPACNQYGELGGTLWGPKKGTQNEFVCRKCRLEWTIDCKSMSNEEVMWSIKEKRKS